MFLLKVFFRKMPFWWSEVLFLTLETTQVIQASYATGFKRKIQTSIHHTFKKIKYHKNHCDYLVFELLSVQGWSGAVIKNRKNFQKEDDSPVHPIPTSGGRKIYRPLGYIFFIGLSVSLCLQEAWLKSGISFISEQMEFFLKNSHAVNVPPADLQPLSKGYPQLDEESTRPQTVLQEEGNATHSETEKTQTSCNTAPRAHRVQKAQDAVVKLASDSDGRDSVSTPSPSSSWEERQLQWHRVIERNYLDVFQQDLTAFIQEKMLNNENNHTSSNSKSTLKGKTYPLAAQVRWRDLPGLLAQLKKDQVDISIAYSLDEDSRPILDSLFYLSEEFVRLMAIFVTTFPDNPTLYAQDDYPFNFLTYSILQKKFGYLELFLEKSKIDVNEGEFVSGSPLFWAMRSGEPRAVKLLLEHPDIRVIESDLDIREAFNYARKNNHQDIREMLLDRVRIERGLNDPSNEALLYTAIEHYNFSMALILLEDAGIEDSHQDEHGRTALHCATISWYEFRILDFLKARPSFKVNILDEDYRTPLHYAVEKNYKRAVLELVRVSSASEREAIHWGCLSKKAHDCGWSTLEEILLKEQKKYGDRSHDFATSPPCAYCIKRGENAGGLSL